MYARASPCPLSASPPLGPRPLSRQAIGAIAQLVRSDGGSITINVEYNQLDPLLRAAYNPEGDVNDPSTGYSPFPGNINQLVFSLPEYEVTRAGPLFLCVLLLWCSRVRNAPR